MPSRGSRNDLQIILADIETIINRNGGGAGVENMVGNMT